MTFQTYSALSGIIGLVQVVVPLVVLIAGLIFARGHSRWLLPVAAAASMLPVLATFTISVARTAVTPSTVMALVSLSSFVDTAVLIAAAVVAARESRPPSGQPRPGEC